jgi:hypothetical protein
MNYNMYIKLYFLIGYTTFLIYIGQCNICSNISFVFLILSSVFVYIPVRHIF